MFWQTVCSMWWCNVATVACCIKAYWKGKDAVQENLRIERSHVENKTVQLLASLLDADCRWTARESEFVTKLCFIFCTFSITTNLQCIGYPMKFRGATMALLCSSTGLVGPVPKGRLSWTNRRYGQNLGLLIRTKLEMPIKWMEAFWFSSSNKVHRTWYAVKVMYDTEGEHYITLYSKADGKRCLLLHIHAAPPLSRAQEKMMTASFFMTMQGVTPLLHIAPLTMGDSVTSTILTRYESMRLRSLCQSERTTARDAVQHKKWTYPCYRVVNMEHQQRWVL